MLVDLSIEEIDVIIQACNVSINIEKKIERELKEINISDRLWADFIKKTMKKLEKIKERNTK